MALFGPKRRRRAPEIADRIIEAAAPPPRTVGALLREARLRHDADIEDIAARLRIRPGYLEAIEEGRYGELPGAAYALGFVRGYAEHLGLNAHEVARRFKAETAGLDRRQDLSLPMPLPERSRPRGGILLIALIVAACAYALWWYVASGDRSRPERVAAPPEELAPRPEPSFAEVPETKSETETASPAASVAEPPVAPSDTLTQAQPPSAAPRAVEALTTPALQGAPAVMPPAPTASPTTAEAPPVPPAPSAPPVAAVLPPPPPPPVPESAPSPDTPRVYGAVEGLVRIVIKANAESWISIRDRDGTSQSRLLKPGESYRVPDRAGLTMRAGNAGGIEVTVDGKPAPALGNPGQPRNVVLDPARLLAGTAIVSQ
jgi:cytoskeleton protein RodZ